MNYEARLTVFVTVSILAALFVACLFLYSPIKKFLINKNITKWYYHKLIHIAKIHDYYLVNDIHMKLGGKKYVDIDHVLGGDKYIYMIIDYYFDGAVNATSDDACWVIYPKKGAKKSIDNPLKKAKEAVNRFSNATGINVTLIVPIILINDDCFITPIELKKGEPTLTTLKRLDKVIKIYEKEETDPLDPKALKSAIVSLHDGKERDREIKMNEK